MEKTTKITNCRRLMIKTFIIIQVCLMAFIFMNGTADAGEKGDFSRFTLGVKGGINILSDVDSFSVTGLGVTWKLSGSNTLVGAPFVKYALAKNISIEGEFAFEGTSDININTQTISAEYHFNEVWGEYNPYIKAGVLRGDVKVDGFPGEFDDGFGVLIGGGIEKNYNRLVLISEVAYRHLTNTYRRNMFISSSSNSIDLSGLLLKIGVGYRF